MLYSHQNNDELIQSGVAIIGRSELNWGLEGEKAIKVVMGLIDGFEEEMRRHYCG